MPPSTQTATFGSGCFWCTEAIFQQVRGVDSVVSGYAGGTSDGPSYEQVSSGATGHAEVTQLTYDPDVVTYEILVSIFFGTHDPTTMNRQGHDVGEQYRSIIFYHSDKQKTTAETIMKKLADDAIFNDPIVTQLQPYTTFHPAEDYHQNYYQNNAEQPYCQSVISPKLAKFRKQYSEYLTK